MPFKTDISVAQVRWYREHHPEYLTALYTTVYDALGVPSRIRAYKLEEYLRKGFAPGPPDKEGVSPHLPDPEPPEDMPEPLTRGIRTPRLSPGRG